MATLLRPDPTFYPSPRLAIDPHSPPEFRCNGVIRNMDAFYDAFDVSESDELYLDPQRRVRIWN